MRLRLPVRVRAMSARGLVVALGVPAAFAASAALLAFGSPVGTANAATVGALPAPAPRLPAAPVAPEPLPAELIPPVTGHDYSVRRRAVVDPRRLVRTEPTVRTEDPVAFITIDDGIVKDRAGLEYVLSRQLPVTAFVTTWTVKDQADYFSRITQWGSIQNHSATHASFAKRSTDLDHEICYSQRMLTRTFGTKPWMLRPPFGAASDGALVAGTAARCGISDLVLWDAYVYKGKLVATGKLRRGSIVLLHFSRHLEQDLRVAVAALHRAGLRPASLADYLPPGS